MAGYQTDVPANGELGAERARLRFGSPGVVKDMFSFCRVESDSGFRRLITWHALVVTNLDRMANLVTQKRSTRGPRSEVTPSCYMVFKW